jgi:hypothetical protein
MGMPGRVHVLAPGRGQDEREKNGGEFLHGPECSAKEGPAASRPFIAS